ncbi:MAG: hypothetical protein GX098_06415 [Bacteroidales bacterium]|nr:hypothetical protein [Bacteroidales bacterium]
MVLLRKTIYVTLILCAFWTADGKSQANEGSRQHPDSLQQSEASLLDLRVRGMGFFRNSEFRNSLAIGTSMAGASLEPVLEFRPEARTTLSAGVHLLKYAGRDNFDRVLPVIRYQYKPSERFTLIFGTLYGSATHRLPEPVFDFEQSLINDYENGIQLLLNFPSFKSDIWVYWEQFIKAGDPFQEMFTAGMNSSIVFYDSPNLQLSTPLITLFRHQGGEIDSTDLPASTRLNLVQGFRADFTFGKRFFRSAWANFLWMEFTEVNPGGHVTIPYGHGTWCQAGVKTSLGNLEAGYWRGVNFIAPHGMPLYQSVSQKTGQLTEPERRMITMRYELDQQLTPYLRLLLRLEPYYDLNSNRIDHIWTACLAVDGSFFLARRRRSR